MGGATAKRAEERPPPKEDRARAPEPPEARPSRRAVWWGERYEVVVREHEGKLHVAIEPLGPLGYMGCGPFFRICDPRPKVWWQPWTWGRRDVGRAIRAAIRKARRMEGRDARGEVAQEAVVRAAREALT